jgi:DNA-binding phage protein
MVLTRDFRETVLDRARRDRRFRQAMLTGAVNELLAGDVGAGKAMLRDYINATVTFERLAAVMGKPSKSLQRMLGPNGNPTAANIFSMLWALQETENVRLEVRAAAT